MRWWNVPERRVPTGLPPELRGESLWERWVRRQLRQLRNRNNVSERGVPERLYAAVRRQGVWRGWLRRQLRQLPEWDDLPERRMRPRQCAVRSELSGRLHPPPPPDLDCGDIPYRNFRVSPPDPHGFDTDHDGIGCESA